MFAPEGFVPFSEIVKDIFIKNQEISKRLEEILRISLKGNEGNSEDDFLRLRASRARQYSFCEVSELALFNITEGVPKFVIHPDKRPLSFDLPILMNLHAYRYLYRAVKSDRRIYGASGVSGSDYFDFGLDWPHYESKIDDYVKKSKDPWSITFLEFPHTSINLFYNRSTYLIDLDEARLVRSHELDEFDLKSYGYPFNLNAIEPFEGCSICVKEKDYNLESLQRLYEIEVFKIVLSACWGDKFTEELMENHNFAVSFPNVEDVDSKAINKNIASEVRAVKFLNNYLDNNEFSGILIDLRNLLPEDLGERAFRRVVDRVRENHPDISKPGRRSKS